MLDVQDAWRQNIDDSDEEDVEDNIREEYSIQTLVDALGGGIGPKALKNLLG